MDDWRSRWMTWEPTAHRTCKTPKRPDGKPFAGFEGSFSRARPSAIRDLDAGDIEAVRLTGTVLGDVWLVRDEEVAGRLNADAVPVFYFREVENLRGKDVGELQAIAAAKRVFPGSSILQ